MMATIDNLPDELLLAIFEYLPAENLTMAVPLVSARWKALSQRISLWKHLTFTPPISMSEEEVAYSLQRMPHLRSFRLQHGENIDYIVNTLCEHCPEIRHIVMERKRGPSIEMVFKLLTRYKELECLNVHVPEDLFQIDFAKMYGMPCLGSASFTALGLQGLRWLDSGIESESVLCNPSLEDINRTLRSVKDTLTYLTIFAKLTSVDMGLIYECEHLRSLILHDDFSDAIYLDFNSLTKLKYLGSLQLCIFPHCGMGEFHAQCDLPCLVKLEIVTWTSFPNSIVSLMFNICPNLQHVKLQTIGLRDDSFINMTMCQRLKYIDISFNFLLTDKTVKYIADQCPQLQFLDVSSCFSMTEDIINTLSELRHIEELWLDYQNFSGQSLCSIPAQLPTLSTLRAKNCNCLDPYVISELKTNFPNFKLIK
jgi:hypothetical protein